MRKNFSVQCSLEVINMSFLIIWKTLLIFIWISKIYLYFMISRRYGSKDDNPEWFSNKILFLGKIDSWDASPFRRSSRDIFTTMLIKYNSPISLFRGMSMCWTSLLFIFPLITWNNGSKWVGNKECYLMQLIWIHWRCGKEKKVIKKIIY